MDDANSITVLQSSQHERISNMKCTSLRQFENQEIEHEQFNASIEKMDLSVIFSALCTFVKTRVESRIIVSYGLKVILYWLYGVPIERYVEFQKLIQDRVIQDVLLSPKTNMNNQRSSIRVLIRIVECKEIFQQMKSQSKSTFLFNRIVRLLSNHAPTIDEELILLQCDIITLLSRIIHTYSIDGIQFLLENTHGHRNEVNGDKSILFHLITLLDHYTLTARLSNTRIENKQVEHLVQETFLLFHLLMHYVESIYSILSSPIHMIHLHTILLWISKHHLPPLYHHASSTLLPIVNKLISNYYIFISFPITCTNSSKYLSDFKNAFKLASRSSAASIVVNIICSLESLINCFTLLEFFNVSNCSILNKPSKTLSSSFPSFSFDSNTFSNGSTTAQSTCLCTL